MNHRSSTIRALVTDRVSRSISIDHAGAESRANDVRQSDGSSSRLIITRFWPSSTTFVTPFRFSPYNSPFLRRWLFSTRLGICLGRLVSLFRIKTTRISSPLNAPFPALYFVFHCRYSILPPPFPVRFPSVCVSIRTSLWTNALRV